ncbi:DNA recombination protein RmuC [Frateuria sp. GZRe14]|uniref:DNA recombination protein RmuC n=1 Tax=Frateuria sp. GZRe14 TaxID=3351534 RepID=UPI003EDC2426
MVMPIWGWGLVVLASTLGVLWRWTTRRQLLSQLSERDRQVQELRDRVDALARDAARLPDALDRVVEMETTAKQLQQAITEATAREAGLQAQRQTALEQVAVLQQERDTARASLELERDAASQLRAAHERAAAERTAATDQAGVLQAERDAARLALDAEKDATAQLRAANARAIAERAAAVEAYEGVKQFLTNAEEQLRNAFLAASSQVFDQKAAALDQRIKDSGEASKRGLDETLKPFADRIAEFQAEARKLHDDSATKVATLTGNIQNLQTLNQHMATATENLARALKGNAKARGDWGEMILDTVLKASGLEEGTNFLKQDPNRDEESGRLRKPDVIVNLPDGQQVVVDSKVNLVAWADACNAESPESYQDALIRHTAALRQHVRDLADKNYPKVVGPSALDMTILFVPIEGALAAALSVNHDLQTEAFAKRVVFASPNTLMAMLRVVERLWMRDKLQKQVGKIGEEAGKLLDSLAAFLEEFQAIGNSLDKTRGVFDTARNRLIESPQSVTARAKRLVEAGAKGKKALPDELLPVMDVPALSLETTLD